MCWLWPCILHIMQCDLLEIFSKCNWCNCHVADAANTLKGKHTQVIDMRRLNQPALRSFCALWKKKNSEALWGILRTGIKSRWLKNNSLASSYTFPVLHNLSHKTWMTLIGLTSFVMKSPETQTGEATTASGQAGPVLPTGSSSVLGCQNRVL